MNYVSDLSVVIVELGIHRVVRNFPSILFGNNLQVKPKSNNVPRDLLLDSLQRHLWNRVRYHAVPHLEIP